MGSKPIYFGEFTAIPKAREVSRPQDLRLDFFKRSFPIGSSAAEMPAEFRGDKVFITPTLAASRLHAIWR